MAHMGGVKVTSTVQLLPGATVAPLHALVPKVNCAVGRPVAGPKVMLYSPRLVNVPVTVSLGTDEKTFTVDQRKAPNAGKTHSLGSFTIGANVKLKVTVSNAGTNGYVVVDGLQLVPVK